jgi:hypothetical protein
MDGYLLFQMIIKHGWRHKGNRPPWPVNRMRGIYKPFRTCLVGYRRWVKLYNHDC